MRDRAARAALLATLLFTLRAPALPAAERNVASEGEWHKIFLRGQPAGFGVVREVPLEKGGVETLTRTRLTMRREGTVVGMEMRVAVREDTRGKILGFEIEQEMSQDVRIQRGRIEEGEIVLEEPAPSGSTRTSRLPFDPRAIGPHAAERELREKLKKEGDEVELVIFVADAIRASRQRSVLGPMEEVKLPGGVERLRRVTHHIEILPQAPVTEWRNAEGAVVKTKLASFEMEVYRSTRDEILREDFGSPPEIFIASAIRLAKPLSPRRREVLYEIRPKDGAGPIRLEPPGAAGHVLEAGEEGAWHLRVTAVEPQKTMPRPLPATPELAVYLAPNSYIQSDDSEVALLAAKAAGDEPDSWKAAQKLERWVHQAIREKNLETAFASASEVARTRQGDCTEHAVLLAAMARALGIPARVVAGLVYYRQSFVGHMWTEVYTGEWVPLDGTIGRGGVEADHIALATSALDTGSVSDLFLALLPVLSGMEIDVVEAR